MDDTIHVTFTLRHKSGKKTLIAETFATSGDFTSLGVDFLKHLAGYCVHVYNAVELTHQQAALITWLQACRFNNPDTHCPHCGTAYPYDATMHTCGNCGKEMS